jgi:excisionase family DNA binding protein
MDHTTDGYLTLREAAEVAGCHPKTLQRRIAEGTLAVYRAETHRRRPLVKREDIDRLRTPRPKEALLASA